MNVMNIGLALLATILWGMWAIFEKKLALNVNVYWANVYYGVVGLTFLPVYLFFAVKFGGDFQFKSSTMGWTYLAGLSSALAGMVYLYLLSKHPTNWVTSFTASYPLVTLFISAVVLKEELTIQAVLGALIIVIGLIVLNF